MVKHKREVVSFICPGPGGQAICEEGALYLPGENESTKDCPRCGGTGELELPSKLEVCGRCRGRGVHDHEAFSNGISMDEFREDPDFYDDYRAGVYDVTCSECGGRNVVPVVDEVLTTAADLQAYYRHLQEEASYRRECEAERRMGA